MVYFEPLFRNKAQLPAAAEERDAAPGKDCQDNQNPNQVFVVSSYSEHLSHFFSSDIKGDKISYKSLEY